MMAATEHGEALRHVLESPHALTFSPEGHAAISRMQSNAHERIRLEAARVAAALGADGAAVDYDAARRALVEFERDTWQNLAAVFASMMGLGGKVTREDERNLYVTAPHLTYGVNQSRHDGTWSVNS